MTQEDRIRRRAYEIWERENRPEGRHEEHWRRAADEIRAEDAAAAGAAGGTSGKGGSKAGEPLRPVSVKPKRRRPGSGPDRPAGTGAG